MSLSIPSGIRCLLCAVLGILARFRDSGFLLFEHIDRLIGEVHFPRIFHLCNFDVRPDVFAIEDGTIDSDLLPCKPSQNRSGKSDGCPDGRHFLTNDEIKFALVPQDLQAAFRWQVDSELHLSLSCLSFLQDLLDSGSQSVSSNQTLIASSENLSCFARLRNMATGSTWWIFDKVNLLPLAARWAEDQRRIILKARSGPPQTSSSLQVLSTSAFAMSSIAITSAPNFPFCIDW